MKNFKKSCSIFLFCLFCGVTSYAQPFPLNDTVECMKAIGLATSAGAPLDSAVITIFKGNEVVEWSEITSNPKHDHHFSYNLLGNSYYTIQVSKTGYVTRSIGIDTRLPKDFVISYDNPKTSFEFEVDVFKTDPTKEDDLMDFPIALVKFNTTTQLFEFDSEYTKKLKKKLGY